MLKVPKNSFFYNSFNFLQVYSNSISVNDNIKEKSPLNIKIRFINTNLEARSLEYRINFLNILLILFKNITKNKSIL